MVALAVVVVKVFGVENVLIRRRAPKRYKRVVVEVKEEDKDEKVTKKSIEFDGNVFRT